MVRLGVRDAGKYLLLIDNDICWNRADAFRVYPDPSASVAPTAATSSYHLPYREIHAHVTGFNTVVKQTDREPCIGAMGTNICGRRNVIACPHPLAFGTVVQINDKLYVCEDRTARKYRLRFDIDCDKNKGCPYEVAGWTTVKIFDQ
jgi:hypothetical protein